ncbi:MAG TPA: AMP-binding protein [Acidimicrobiia bacterium]|nr:AMP-binding protein [Acidimicrobiia bacterium]
MIADGKLATPPAPLAQRYLGEGLWTDDTLASAIERFLLADPARAFRVWSETRSFTATLGAVFEDARRFAGALRRHGIGPGDVVAFQLPNWMEAAVVFWGTALSGAVLVPIVHFYGPREVGYILAESGARALVTADRFGHLDYLASLEQIRPGLSDLELVVVVGDTAPTGAVGLSTFLDGADAVEHLPDVDPSGPALVAYTSGTTADPKGVVHTHRSLVAEMRQLGDMQPSHARPLLVGAPVGHAIGMLSGLLLPLYKGHPVSLIDQWDPGRILAAMVEADLMAGSGATYFLTSLLDHPDFGPEHAARMTRIGLGGSPVPQAVADRAEGMGILIVRSYGSTEHPSVTGAQHHEPREKRNRTDGHPLPGVELRIVDDDGRDLGPGEDGEILTRGPDLFGGYTDPALTAAAIDADGWYHTGDIGVVDADGWLTITDRKSDVIIRGGENVSAAELEGLLARLDGVAEVAVVAAPDHRLGEHACAYLRLHAGAAPPDLDAVRQHFEAAGVARQKWPEEIRIVDDFPRTPSGKVKKFVLRERRRKEEGA